MFDMHDLFGSFKKYELNGALAMIMQEEEDFEKAKILLKEFVKSYGLFENEKEMQTILTNFRLSYDNLLPEHKQELIETYVRI